ncbi:MAG: hypothetical protein JNM46_07025, partial [Anaerolineales bacterium]|nr:hypothetical protein [Anaerolineales bacterium]
GFNINIPGKIQPGPEVKEDIKIPYPTEEEVNLKLSFGAGDLTLSPGANDLVEGTVTYNYEALKPEVNTEGGDVEIKMGEVNFTGFPSFDEITNEWDFKLSEQPMNLDIDSGAYQGEFEFGGLSLTNLTITDGAADVNVSFSEPNQVEMTRFNYSTGASNLRITGLANANFSIFDFSSGAGDYTLDFSGELQRDATIKISSGLSNVILVIPEGVNAIVTVEGGALNVNTDSGWSQNGSVYEQKGEGHTLTFIIEMGAGNLTITD